MVEGLDVLKERFETMMEEARQEYLPITPGKTGDKAVEAVLEHFRDKEIRQRVLRVFRRTGGALRNPVARCLPAARSWPDYNKLADIYRIVRASYERGVPVDKELDAEDGQTGPEHTQTGASARRARFTS